LNILLVSAMYPPIRTGTSFYSQNLATALTARGHEVTVVTLWNREANDPPSAVPVHRLPALLVPLPGLFKHFRVASVFPQNYLALARLAAQTQAQIILVVNHYLDIVFPAIYAARRNRIALACSVGTQLQSTRPWRDRWLNRLDRLICGNLVFPFCDRIIAWDNEILRYLAEVHGARVTDKAVIVNFAPHGRTDALAAHRPDYRLKHQILGVGAVTEQRDFVSLIRAFALLAPRFPALRLKIVGHVYHDTAVRTARDLGVAQRITFTGEQSHEVVIEEMRLSDVFFVSLSGRYVGLGTATIEAMLLGIPVVANVPSRLVGDDAMLEDLADFAYADGNNHHQIAERIGALLSDEQLRARIGQGGRRFVSKHLNWPKVAHDMEAALSGVTREMGNT